MGHIAGIAATSSDELWVAADRFYRCRSGDCAASGELRAPVTVSATATGEVFAVTTTGTYARWSGTALSSGSWELTDVKRVSVSESVVCALDSEGLKMGPRDSMLTLKLSSEDHSISGVWAGQDNCWVAHRDGRVGRGRIRSRRALGRNTMA